MSDVSLLSFKSLDPRFLIVGDSSTSPDPANDKPKSKHHSRPQNSKLTERYAQQRFGAPHSRGLGSKGTSDDDQKLAAELEALLEELQQNPGGAGDLQKELQDLQKQIRDSLKKSGVSDADVDKVMKEIGDLAGKQGSERAAAIKDILDQTSKLTGKSADELAAGIKDILNKDIQDNKDVEQYLVFGQDIEKLLADLKNHPGGAQDRLDAIKNFLKGHNVSDDDITNIMDQIEHLSGTSSDASTIAKLLKQISDLTGVPVKDLASKIEDRINLDIGNNKSFEAAEAAKRQAMIDAAKSKNPDAQQAADLAKNMDLMMRGVFLTEEDREKLGYLDIRELKRNMYGSADGRHSNSSPALGLTSGILIADGGNANQGVDDQIEKLFKEFQSSLKGMFLKLDPEGGQVFDETFNKLRQQFAKQPLPGSGKGLGNPPPQGKGLGDSQPGSQYDVTQTASFQEFLLRMESAKTTEEGVKADKAVTKRLSDDQASENEKNYKAQLDAIQKKEAYDKMSPWEKFWHNVKQAFVDFGNAIVGIAEVLHGLATGNKAEVATGAMKVLVACVDVAKHLMDAVLGPNDKRDKVMDQIANVAQDVALMIAGAIEVAVGVTTGQVQDVAFGGMMLAAGSVALQADLISDLLDAVDMDPAKRAQMQKTLGYVRDVAFLIGTIVSIASAFRKFLGKKGPKEGGEGEKAAKEDTEGAAKEAEKEAEKSAEKAAERSAERAAENAKAKTRFNFEKLTNGVKLGANIAENGVLIVSSGVDIAAAKKAMDAAKAKRDAALIQADLDLSIRTLKDSFTHFGPALEALQSYAAGLFDSMNIAFKLAGTKS
ncbi:MAG: hypothetical protein C5B47_00910 [Verrucomicrobia bacterium]|nr:MAG: hypothetical protein C5B47_00910 [Verrucomicrobiota bacterium]